jgi:glycosyltransferase involved in cell wall biosynthesis
MKIIYVIRYVDKGGGGIIVEIEKANALAEKGHEVILCCCNGVNSNSVPRRPISSKVRLIDLHASDEGISTKSISYLKYLKSYRQKLQDVVNIEKPDVLVATENGGKYVTAFIKSPRGHKMIKVREYHYASNMYKSQMTSKWRLLLHRVSHYCGYKVQSLLYDKIYLLTHRDKMENFPYNDKFDVMPNPLTINILPPSPSRESIGETSGRCSSLLSRENIVIFLGRLDNSSKNLVGLLHIWAKTQKDGWILKIVGEGPDRQMLENLVDSLELRNSVTFTGWINNPSSILQTAKLFCLTSFYEGFALVIAEAMASGLPVVSYNLPYGPSDIITDGEDGLLIPYLDEDAFAKKLSGLMANEEKIRSMSKAAILKSQQFSVDKIVDTWIAKYNELLS